MTAGYGAAARPRRGNWLAASGMVTFVSMFEAASWLEKLNDEQRRAATHPDGPLLVLAGAGTGKTGTLVARAAWLRSQGVPAGRILLLTFTRRAADDILARIAPRAAVCADIYTRCVNTRTVVADVVQSTFPWCADFTAQLSGLFRDYVAHKRRHGLVDFDDLLLLWQAALADAAAGPVLRGLFDAVLVDEYQDVNAVQADIVRLLAPDGRGLTCVGDDAQAVYGFRGADPAHLRSLADTYPGLSVIRLTRNYRSKAAVLRLANVVRPQSDGLELALTADQTGGQAPVLVRCHDEATQAREICARVLAAHESGLDLRAQAVLVRAANHSDVLEVELSARGIPFVKYGGLKFTEAAHVKDFLAAARVVANPSDDLAWFRLLRLHEGIGPVHARRMIDALRLAEPAPLGRWQAALDAVPQRSRPAVAATIAALTAAADLERTADRAGAILAA